MASRANRIGRAVLITIVAPFVWIGMFLAGSLTFAALLSLFV